MRNLLWTLCVLFCAYQSNAEGTRELAPNGNIMINGVVTTDIAALLVGHASHGEFAWYDNPDPEHRLYLHIQDPATECIYLGFSPAHSNGGSNIDFEFRIKDPNGRVVFGPISVSQISPQINNWGEGFNGPEQIYGAAGYKAIQVPSSALTSLGWTGKGDYYIEFQSFQNSEFLIDFWDITVADCSGVQPLDKKGRIWSNNWALFAKNDFGFPERPFNGAFYVCAPDLSDATSAFITKVDFNNSGFRPAAFSVAFNSFGVSNTGGISLDRKSVELVNSTLPEYEIFLNDPVDLCKTATAGSIQLVGVSRCDVNDFCIKFISTKEGQIDILLDFDGRDGIYTPGTADVIISANISPSMVGKEICLDWDGLDGLGQRLPETTSTEIPIVVSYAQGIYHFPIYDAELLTNGLSIESVRPAGPKPLLFYDDSQISVSAGLGEPQVQLTGCTQPCHGWTTYTGSNDPGFGNLNTINTWWFSQQTITEAVFNLPAYYLCNLTTPNELCPDEEGRAGVNMTLFPPDGQAMNIIKYEWSGPGVLGTGDQSTVTVNQPGLYTVSVSYINETGDTCTTTCMQNIDEAEQVVQRIDTLIIKGDTVKINNEVYTETGDYMQQLNNNMGCDTLLLIHVLVAQSTVYYDFNDCRSVTSDSTDKDYTEFIALYPEPLLCADVGAEFLRREMPQRNPHSCTPGVMDSPAMCVGSLDSCEYLAGHEKSIVFSIHITPHPDTAVLVTRLSFYERAPLMFDWINGPSGPNNYPTYYGLRILKDGTEIFNQHDIPTTQDWTKEVFELRSIPELLIEEESTLRFELLGYCTHRDSIAVNAWDIDELSVDMACAPKGGTTPLVYGRIQNIAGDALAGLPISLSHLTSGARHLDGFSDQKGNYAFVPYDESENLYLKVTSPSDYTNGITTRDFMMLYRHLLGRVSLSDFDQWLASDVDANDVLDVRDLVQLRSLILGKKEAFDSKSWIYGCHTYEPTEQIDLFDETCTAQNKGVSSKVDILGIKVGDLDRSAIPGFSKTQPRTPISMGMTGRDQYVTQNEEIWVDFEVNSQYEFVGLQMVLSSTEATILEVASNLPEFSQAQYHIHENNASFVWGNLSSVTKGRISMRLKIAKSGWLSERIALGWTPSLKTNEGYAEKDLFTMPLSLIWEGKNDGEEQDQVLAYPNPSPNGIFLLQSEQDSPIIGVQTYSAEGRKHPSQWDGRQLMIDGKGVFIVQVIMRTHTLTTRVIVP